MLISFESYLQNKRQSFSLVALVGLHVDVHVQVLEILQALCVLVGISFQNYLRLPQRFK